MKKKLIGLVGALALSGITLGALTACSGGKTDVYFSNGTLVEKLDSKEILFKDNSTVPYINVEDGAELMSVIRSANLDDQKYKVSFKKENNNYVLSNETGTKCVISPENQTLVFDEYDKFSFIVPENTSPLSLGVFKSKDKALKIVSQEYTKGNEVTIDLKPYSKLDVYEKNDKCYLPLSVFNSALFNSTANVNLAYNGKDLFIISGETLTRKNLLGETELTPLGEKFRDGTETGSITEEFALYNYDSMCFDFNYSYGLKDKFKSFDEYLSSLGYKSEMITTDPKKTDNYTAIALSYLSDAHTALSTPSNLYKFNDFKVDEEKMNKEKSDWYKSGEEYAAARKLIGGFEDGIKYVEDTAFVTFSEFTDINEDLLYNTTSDKSLFDDDFTGLDDGIGLDFGGSESAKLSNTACLFNELYKELNSDEHKWTTKNIVVDVSANDGGSAQGLLYALSTLIGNVNTYMINPLSGARSHQVYKADMNADGKIDDNDKSLADLGYKIYFLDSKYSFSSANAMPVIAKQNNSNVITLGDKTAGGPCAVRYSITPIGTGFNSSSLSTIAKPSGDSFVNIDGGVEADFKLEEAQMVNRKYIQENIKNWTK